MNHGDYNARPEIAELYDHVPLDVELIYYVQDPSGNTDSSPDMIVIATRKD